MQERCEEQKIKQDEVSNVSIKVDLTFSSDEENQEVFKAIDSYLDTFYRYLLLIFHFSLLTIYSSIRKYEIFVVEFMPTLYRNKHCDENKRCDSGIVSSIRSIFSTFMLHGTICSGVAEGRKR